MSNRSMKIFFHRLDSSINLLKSQAYSWQLVFGVLSRLQSHSSQADKPAANDLIKRKDSSEALGLPTQKEKITRDSDLSKYHSDDDDLNDNKWKLELAWLSRALEPALQFCRWALPSGNDNVRNIKPLPSSRSLSEIVASIQRSKIGIQDWSLSDLTVGLYLIYLRQASADQVEDVKGIEITSDSTVEDLIYHVELAKGAYREDASGLARNSMLREQNILKFVKNSNVMRPGYYIGIDTRNKLIILGIRGTHTVYDLITDIVASSENEGYSTHFGTAEAARWFIHHEIETIKECLSKHKGFRLRLVGHSLGGAAASLLAIMLRKMSKEELGFSPQIISAVGFATPPCVSRELSESCSDYVSTVVMQDDIIPRLSISSLKRLRNEILHTDWTTVLEKEDWKSVIDVLINAKQVMSSVQDVARKLADYANFISKTNASDVSVGEKLVVDVGRSPSIAADAAKPVIKQHETTMHEELVVPGTLYYLKRCGKGNNLSRRNSTGKGRESYSLWKILPGEHFNRIVLSSNLISDHKCDNHYYALRDVLKGLPHSEQEGE